jgi:Holliday junction DNA helicase RuvB
MTDTPAAAAERFVAPVLREREEELDSSLRPASLADFVGQERVKEQLAVALDAAKGRGEALDHVLLAGPPGLGKTSPRSSGGSSTSRFARSLGRRSSGRATSRRS